MSAAVILSDLHLGAPNSVLNLMKWPESEVAFCKHVGHVLAQALTLGIWAPLKVSWRCNRPVPPTGTLDGRPQ